MTVGQAPVSRDALPRHVAIIMDGNGRWASKHYLPRVKGHEAGAKSVRRIVECCRTWGIRHLTLFCFSSENWSRPEEEVTGLMRLLRRYLESELETLLKNDIRLRAIGDVSRLPAYVREPLEQNMARTTHHSSMDLTLAVSYGAREEIVRAAQSLARRAAAGEIKAEDIDESLVASELWTNELPDPDLLIRTSGEMRISNFLLWQVAYSEIVVTPEYWPDFDEQVFARCLTDFARRERRFGLTSDQLAQGQGNGLRKRSLAGVEASERESLQSGGAEALTWKIGP